MARSSRKMVEELENQLLEAVEGASSPRCPACLSLRAFAHDLGVSESRVRNAQRNLVRAGLLQAEPRFARDGGQLANGYRLTREGRARLKEALSSHACYRS